MRLLLKNGANVNADDGTHGLALLEASRDGYEEVVRLLLERAAKINAEHRMYRTRWLQQQVWVRRR